MSETGVSFVVMTWNRGGQRVTNLLRSLLEHQDEPAVEVVLVDTSNDEAVASDIAERAAGFDRCKLIQVRRNNLFKAWALNVGIKATDPESAFVAVTDIDFMFGPQLVSSLKKIAGPGRFICAEPRRLSADADLSDPFSGDNYGALAASAEPWRNGSGWGVGPGTLQCAARAWWHHVRGYDERYARGLGEVDNDVVRRAMKSGLKIRRLPFRMGQALHQWHPASSLKRKFCKPLKNTRVVANPNGWGEGGAE